MKKLSNIFSQKNIFKFVNYVILIFFSIIILFPILIVFNVSFKTQLEYASTRALQIAESYLNLDNYFFFLQSTDFGLAFKNTMIILFLSVTLSVTMSSMVAYVIDRFDFKMKNVILLGFLIGIIIPTITTQVALFTVIKSLNLYNTIFACVILYSAADAIQIYIFLQFMSGIPRSLDESAYMDGASYFGTFTKIILPQLKPAIATAVVIKTIWVYNDMLYPYLYMPNPELKTITMSLYSFGMARNAQWSIMGAGVMVVMLPTLLLYLLLQKHIISGITQGSVKE